MKFKKSRVRCQRTVISRGDAKSQRDYKKKKDHEILKKRCAAGAPLSHAETQSRRVNSRRRKTMKYTKSRVSCQRTVISRGDAKSQSEFKKKKNHEIQKK